MDYAIATFCYGERYYNQANRLIMSLNNLETPPEIFIVTDNPDAITTLPFVRKKNIADYSEKYLSYHKNYYGFDFSVKRFSVLFAFESGYNKVVLVDADAVINDALYTHDKVNECFLDNAIAGQVAYNFNEQVHTNSQLGLRFLHYEKTFNVEYDKNRLISMPEDCIQYISISDDLKFKFIDTWNECIRIKEADNLSNIPAGNIDEMCFAALYNGIDVKNNSDIHINLLYPVHEKWY